MPMNKGYGKKATSTIYKGSRPIKKSTATTSVRKPTKRKTSK